MTARAGHGDAGISILAWIVTTAGLMAVFFAVPLLRGTSPADLYFGGPGFGFLLVIGLGLVWAAWSYGWFHWSSLRNRRGTASKAHQVWLFIRLAALCSMPFIPLAMVVITGMGTMTDD